MDTGKFDRSRSGDAEYCSRWLASHGESSLSAADLRQCMIAIASTYIDAEENSIPPERQLLADDVARHSLGTPAIHEPGNAARIVASDSHAVIGKISNRQWTVDGNQVWIVYDGYLKSDLEKPSFFVCEQFRIEKGLIREIFVAGVKHAT